MKSVRYGLRIILALLISYSASSNDSATYTSIHFETSSDLRPPSPVDLFGALIEHTIGITNSHASTLYKDALCSTIKGCIDYSVQSSHSSTIPVYIGKLNTSEVIRPLPHFYQTFLPALATQNSPSLAALHDSSAMASNILPSHQTDSSTISSSKIIESLPSIFAIAPNDTPRPPIHPTPIHQEKIRAEQVQHVTSLYLKQVSARYINWCYSNDYANLFYPYIPMKAMDKTQLLQKSACKHIVHRLLLLIMHYVQSNLASPYAMPLLFSFTIFAYLRELNHYTVTAVEAIQKWSFLPQADTFNIQGNPNQQRTQMQEEINNNQGSIKSIDKQKRRKEIPSASVSEEVGNVGTTQSPYKNVKRKGKDKEKINRDSITDTLLIACKALVKIPYYLSQDPNNNYFGFNSLKNLVPSSLEDSSLLNNGLLARTIKRCENITPRIIRAYTIRADRVEFRRSYQERERDRLNGRRIVFPQIPMKLMKLRALSQLTRNDQSYCERNESTTESKERLALHCLNKLSTRISLMLGSAVSNLYNISPMHTKTIIPILEKLQTIQLINIYFKHKDTSIQERKNIKINNESNEWHQNHIKDEYKLEETLEIERGEVDIRDENENKILRLVIEDVVKSIVRFTFNLRKALWESLLLEIRKDGYTVNPEYLIMNTGNKVKEPATMHQLEDFFNFIQEKIEDGGKKNVSASAMHTQEKSQITSAVNEVVMGEGNCQDASRLDCVKETNGDTGITEIIEKKEEFDQMSDSMGEIKNEEAKLEEDLYLKVEAKIEEVESLEDELVAMRNEIGEEYQKQKIHSGNKISFNTPRKVIIENLIFHLSNIPLVGCLQKRFDKKKSIVVLEKADIVSQCILDVYSYLAGLYEWSMVASFFMDRNFSTFSYARCLSNSGLSRKDYSYPFKSSALLWMPWSKEYSSNLNRLLNNDPCWIRYLSFMEVRPTKFSNASRQNIDHSLEPTVPQLQETKTEAPQRSQFDFDKFAKGILQAFDILPSMGGSSSVQGLFNGIISNLTDIMDYYQVITFQGGPRTIESILRSKPSASLNHSQLNPLQYNHFAERRVPLLAQNSESNLSRGSISKEEKPHSSRPKARKPVKDSNVIQLLKEAEAKQTSVPFSSQSSTVLNNLSSHSSFPNNHPPSKETLVEGGNVVDLNNSAFPQSGSAGAFENRSHNLNLPPTVNNQSNYHALPIMSQYSTPVQATPYFSNYFSPNGLTAQSISMNSTLQQNAHETHSAHLQGTIEPNYPRLPLQHRTFPPSYYPVVPPQLSIPIIGSNVVYNHMNAIILPTQQQTQQHSYPFINRYPPSPLNGGQVNHNPVHDISLSNRQAESSRFTQDNAHHHLENYLPTERGKRTATISLESMITNNSGKRLCNENDLATANASDNTRAYPSFLSLIQPPLDNKHTFQPYSTADNLNLLRNTEHSGHIPDGRFIYDQFRTFYTPPNINSFLNSATAPSHLSQPRKD